ncbi:MAG TPA: class I SAM-dependent methyltransferase [Chitinophagaceae bacterium]|jgi:ubiquinone/menaquinone biosynthesis C-methylase UbiE|nr:class I SAM-dependent methyltransferase [Chitinophagaceae bacterium]
MIWSWEKQEIEWRKQLLSAAKGNVLEVGVEAGINFRYYPEGVQVTGTGTGERMMTKARTAAATHGIDARFIASPVEELEFPANSFDTIVSTFSLSAYNKPAAVLNQFNEWCKPNGSILLLKYGLSKYGLVSWLQKKWAPVHYKRTGSHIDRNLLSLIAGSNLRLKKVEIKYMGAVYLVWAALRPT